MKGSSRRARRLALVPQGGGRADHRAGWHPRSALCTRLLGEALQEFAKAVSIAADPLVSHQGAKTPNFRAFDAATVGLIIIDTGF
jgi:hypothetical protein